MKLFHKLFVLDFFIAEPPVGIGIEIEPHELLKPVVKHSRLGFDEVKSDLLTHFPTAVLKYHLCTCILLQVYMINLVRRHDRHYRMKTVLELQGIHFNHFKAIDSK